MSKSWIYAWRRSVSRPLTAIPGGTAAVDVMPAGTFEAFESSLMRIPGGDFQLDAAGFAASGLHIRFGSSFDLEESWPAWNDGALTRTSEFPDDRARSLDRALHQAFVAVDEKVQAAAAAVIMGPGIMPPGLLDCRPSFLFRTGSRHGSDRSSSARAQPDSSPSCQHGVASRCGGKPATASHQYWQPGW
jgi:hypothetical protein